MTGYEKENIDATFNGLSLEGRMYLLSKFSKYEVNADILRRMEDKDVAFEKIIEAVTATEYRF